MSVGGGPKEPKESALAKQLATQGTRWLEISDRVVKPAERKVIDRVNDVERDRTSTLGRANTDFRTNFADSRKAVVDSQFNAGAQPGSGKFNAALEGSTQDEGFAQGLGLDDANAAVENQAVGRRQALIDYGQGKGGDAIAGLDRASRVATEQSINDARASAGRRNAAATFVGAGAGAAVGYGLDGAAPAPKRAGAGGFDIPADYQELGWQQ